MRRILVVDDSLEVRRSVRAVLADLVADCTFGEASSAREALAVIEGEPWELVLLDVSLPDRSGFETLREIRRMRPALAVLIMSFHPAAEYEAAARAHGAAGYITKGSSPEAIAGAVNAALGPPTRASG